MYATLQCIKIHMYAHTHTDVNVCVVVVHEYLPLSLFGEKEIQFLFFGSQASTQKTSQI